MTPLLLTLFAMVILLVVLIWLSLHHKLSALEAGIAGELATARGSIPAAHAKLDAALAALKIRSGTG